MEGATWIDEEGTHLVGKGIRPSIEEQERLTKEYQQNIRKSPLWKKMVAEYGKEQAEEMLREFQVEVR
jgi:C-terminal processing protease CtpA/Prc